MEDTGKHTLLNRILKQVDTTIDDDDVVLFIPLRVVEVIDAGFVDENHHVLLQVICSLHSISGPFASPRDTLWAVKMSASLFAPSSLLRSLCL